MVRHMLAWLLCNCCRRETSANRTARPQATADANCAARPQVTNRCLPHVGVVRGDEQLARLITNQEVDHKHAPITKQNTLTADAYRTRESLEVISSLPGSAGRKARPVTFLPRACCPRLFFTSARIGGLVDYALFGMSGPLTSHPRCAKRALSPCSRHSAALHCHAFMPLHLACKPNKATTPPAAQVCKCRTSNGVAQKGSIQVSSAHPAAPRTRVPTSQNW